VDVTIRQGWFRAGSPFGQATLLSAVITALAVSVLFGPNGQSVLFLLGVGITFGGYLLVLWLVLQRAAVQVDNPVLTLASRITAIRATGAVLLGGFIVAGTGAETANWLPAVLFAAVAALDGIDGYVARRMDETSTFGGEFDTQVDAFAILIGTIVAVRLGAAPAVFVAIGLYQYVFFLGKKLRQHKGYAVHDLPPRKRRTYVGATSMIAVFVVLLPGVPSGVTWFLAVIAMIPITYSFAVDWLYAIGWMSHT